MSIRYCSKLKRECVYSSRPKWGDTTRIQIYKQIYTFWFHVQFRVTKSARECHVIDIVVESEVGGSVDTGSGGFESSLNMHLTRNVSGLQKVDTTFTFACLPWCYIRLLTYAFIYFFRTTKALPAFSRFINRNAVFYLGLYHVSIGYFCQVEFRKPKKLSLAS